MRQKPVSFYTLGLIHNLGKFLASTTHHGVNAGKAKLASNHFFNNDNKMFSKTCCLPNCYNNCKSSLFDFIVKTRAPH